MAFSTTESENIFAGTVAFGIHDVYYISIFLYNVLRMVRNMNELTKELIQVASALAVGCTSCLEQHVVKAKELGASDADLQELLQLVRSVKLTSTLTIDELAESMFSRTKTELNVLTQASSCGCGSDSCCS